MKKVTLLTLLMVVTMSCFSQESYNFSAPTTTQSVFNFAESYEETVYAGSGNLKVKQLMSFSKLPDTIQTIVDSMYARYDSVLKPESYREHSDSTLKVLKGILYLSSQPVGDVYMIGLGEAGICLFDMIVWIDLYDRFKMRNLKKLNPSHSTDTSVVYGPMVYECITNFKDVRKTFLGKPFSLSLLPTIYKRIYRKSGV